MKKVRPSSIFMLGGMMFVYLGISIPSISFGEFSLHVSGDGKPKKAKPLDKEIKNEVVPFPSASTAFRSEESEVEQTPNHRLSRQQALSTEDQDLVETTDASGGTMINLQGRFHSVLKVPQDSMDKPFGEPLSPAIP